MVVVVMVVLLQLLPPSLVVAALFLFLHAAPSFPLAGCVCAVGMGKEGGRMRTNMRRREKGRLGRLCCIAQVLSQGSVDAICVGV